MILGKGITVAKKYCGGGSGDYQSQCCVELVCNVPAGKGWCRDVKDGDYPGGSFQYSEYGNSVHPSLLPFLSPLTKLEN